MKTWKNRRRNTRPKTLKAGKRNLNGSHDISKEQANEYITRLRLQDPNDPLIAIFQSAVANPNADGTIHIEKGPYDETTRKIGYVKPGAIAPQNPLAREDLPFGFDTTAATPATPSIGQENPMARPSVPEDTTPEGTPAERAALVAPLSADAATSRLNSALSQFNPMARPATRPTGFPIHAEGALGPARNLQDCERDLAALKEKQRLDTATFQTTISTKEKEILDLKENSERRQAALELAKRQAALAEQAADNISSTASALRSADADSRDKEVAALREHLQSLKGQADTGQLAEVINNVTATLDSIKGQNNQEILRAIETIKASIDANVQAMKTISDAAAAELASVRADATKASQELSEAHASRISELNAAIGKADELRLSAESRAQVAEPAAAKEKARADALDENIARLRKELEDEKTAALQAAERAKAAEETLRAAADAERTKAEAANVSAAQAEEAARAASAKSAGLEATNADIGTRLQAISDEKEAANRSSAEAGEKVRALERASAAAKDVADAENARLVGEVRAAQAALEAARGEAKAAAQAEVARIALERDEATAAANRAAAEMARQAEEARAAAIDAANAAREAADAEANARRTDRPQIIGAYREDGTPVTGTNRAPVGTNITIYWKKSMIHNTGNWVLLVRNPADGSIVDSIFIDKTTASGGPDEFQVNYTVKLGGTTNATILDVLV